MSHFLRLISKNLNLVTPRYTSTAIQNNDFTTVYKFPYIRGIGVINRLKLYQTVLTSIIVPTSSVLNQLNYLTTDEVLFTTIVGLGGIIPLYSFGYFANKLIGIIYLNENEKLVKFSYLDFWGSRKNIIIPIKEVVPFSEVSPSVLDTLYVKVRQFSTKNTLKLCTKYGILDYDKFNKIFPS